MVGIVILELQFRILDQKVRLTLSDFHSETTVSHSGSEGGFQITRHYPQADPHYKAIHP